MLDTPAKLKDSVPGTDIVEAEFENPPSDWIELERLGPGRQRHRT